MINTKLTPITKAAREAQKGQIAKVIWLTGLSGAGKSEVASALEVQLHQRKKHVYVLDSDDVRRGLNMDLGFHVISRSENVRRIAEVAAMMRNAGLIVIVTCISPFQTDRENARAIIGPADFIEVFISTPLDICEQRDPKGLYKKSRSGQLANMTGIDSAYELPTNPDLIIDTSNYSVNESVEKILSYLV